MRELWNHQTLCASPPVVWVLPIGIGLDGEPLPLPPMSQIVMPWSHSQGITPETSLPHNHRLGEIALGEIASVNGGIFSRRHTNGLRTDREMRAVVVLRARDKWQERSRDARDPQQCSDSEPWGKCDPHDCGSSRSWFDLRGDISG